MIEKLPTEATPIFLPGPLTAVPVTVGLAPVGTMTGKLPTEANSRFLPAPLTAASRR
jgi:hypothetical protein